VTETSYYSICVLAFITNLVNQFIIPILRELGPLAFALSLTIFLDVGFFKTFMFALKVLILSLSLTMLYGWVYIANEFVTKQEPPELRTMRFGEAVTMVDVTKAFLARILMSQLIILLGVEVGIFSLHEYLWTTIAGGLLILLMILHQVLSWEMRSLSTLPLLRILRILYVFLPLTNELLGKYWIFVYAFALTLPHMLNYFGSKLIRSTLKTNEYTIIFSRNTYTIRKYLLQMSLMFLVFSAFSPLIFTSSLEPLRIVIYPVSVIVYLCIYDLFKRALLSLDSFSGMRA